MKRLLLFLVLAVSSACIFAQSNPDRAKDEAIAEKFFRSAPKTTIDSAIIGAALFFLETPYVAGTLDKSDKEELVVNLREMDCMTFVENCVALSRTLQYPSPDLNYFERELRQIRYRNGVINGYTSRLHYATDWIFDNAGKDIFEDVTYALGGRKLKTDIHYMSDNYLKYSHLANNPEEVQQMIELEQKINARGNYYFIPKQEIERRQPLIKNGDIICFTTSISGLDISHLGIAYRYKGQLTFIHASLKAGKIIINPESLADYCRMIKTNTGIMVLRPVLSTSN
jgi:cell wall-associated NlpC family hydrolase